KLRFYTKDQQLAKPEELVYRSYLNPDDHTQIISQPRYQNQLQQLALSYGQSNEKLTNTIETTAYTEKDIVDVVNSINGGEKKDNNVHRTKPIRFFAGVGVSESNLKYSGD